MSQVFVDGSQNMLHKSSFGEASATLRTVTERCDVWGMQEAWGPTVERAVRNLRKTKAVAMYVPTGSAGAVPIAWDSEVFKSMGPGGYRRTHRGLAKVTPSRYFTWKPLLHRATEARVLKVNTHAVSAYAKDKFPASQDVRDADAKIHWEVGADLTRAFIKSCHYDVILLGGDFNVRLENTDEGWYPSTVLKPLYVFDHVGGIDRLLHTKDSLVQREARRNTRKGIHSDHPLAWQRLRLL
jgi:hypothetical protein